MPLGAKAVRLEAQNLDPKLLLTTITTIAIHTAGSTSITYIASITTIAINNASSTSITFKEYHSYCYYYY